VSIQQKIQAARTALILDQPFFGALALRLKTVEDPHCPTAYTDGQVLGYNPTFMEALTQEIQRPGYIESHRISQYRGRGTDTCLQ